MLDSNKDRKEGEYLSIEPLNFTAFTRRLLAGEGHHMLTLTGNVRKEEPLVSDAQRTLGDEDEGEDEVGRKEVCPEGIRRGIRALEGHHEGRDDDAKEDEVFEPRLVNDLV